MLGDTDGTLHTLGWDWSSEFTSLVLLLTGGCVLPASGCVLLPAGGHVPLPAGGRAGRCMGGGLSVDSRECDEF